MAKYSNVVYKGSTYGQTPRLLYSVQPFSSIAIDYYEVALSWASPTGDFTAIRLVRNQIGFPETEEDGVILYYEQSSSGSLSRTTFSDGIDNFADSNPYNDIPLTSGRYVYYRMWLRKTDNTWAPAGDTYVILPKSHNSFTPAGSRTSVGNYTTSTSTITSIARSGTLVTVTTANNHGYRVPFPVTVASTAHSAINGTFNLVSAYNNVFTYNTITTGDITSVSETGTTSSVTLSLVNTELPYSNVLNTQDKFMDYLPRVFTSASQSPIDEVDKTSGLYAFMGAFSFTLDSFLTAADLLLPENSGTYTSPELTALAQNQLGITEEASIALKNQKRLVREAIYMYSRKGTYAALKTMVESLTGYAPTITASPNIMLSPQDSTFYNGIGYWLPIGDSSIALEQTTLTPTAETNSIDNQYCAKIVVGTAGAHVRNGADLPVLHGIPVSAGTSYTFSYYTKKSTGTGSVVPSITWYDYKGTALSPVATGSSQTASTSWGKQTVTAQAPGYSGTVTAAVVATVNVATLTISSGHPFTVGSSIYVSSVGSPYDGSFTVTAYTATSVSYAVTNAVTSSTNVIGIIASTATAAVYASIDLQFNTVGTYYLDLVQFANSTTTTFYDARGVSIFLNPNKINFLSNPSFEVSTGSAWAINGTSISYPATTLTGVYDGSKMLQFTTNVGSTSLSSQSSTGIFTTGKFYTFSLYAKTTSGSETLNLRAQAYDSSNNAEVERLVPVTLTTSWQRFQVNLYVPSTFATATTYSIVSLYGTGTGKTINVDSAQLEPFYLATDYFDGSLPVSYGAVWAGTANASTSYLYTKKSIKIPRLLAKVVEFVPQNTPYIITSFAGTEGTGIA